MKKFKKVMKMIGKILWTILVALAVLMVLGTFWPSLPLFGMAGNFLTVSTAQIWIWITAAGAILCTITVCRKRSVWNWILFGLSVLAVIGSIVIICQVDSSLKKSGEDVSFFQSYSKDDVSDVKMETKTYENQVGKNSKLDVYYTDDGKTDKPVIIYIHGGGWIAGSRKEHSYMSQKFAQNGYVVISADYDLSSKTEPQVNTNEKQLTYAFAWVKNNISGYSGNYKDLYVVGDSAGGNIALDLAYKINDGTYKTAGSTTLPTVKAVSMMYPATDLTAMYNTDEPIAGKYIKQVLEEYTGTTPQKNADLYMEYSPINNISNSTPPTNILLGTNDVVVESKTSYGFIDKLEDAGVDTNVIKVKYGNHLCDTPEGNVSSQAFISSTLKWFETYQ